jgi:hypothetical protein
VESTRIKEEEQKNMDPYYATFVVVNNSESNLKNLNNI